MLLAVLLGVAVRVGSVTYVITTDASAPTSGFVSIRPSAKQYGRTDALKMNTVDEMKRKLPASISTQEAVKFNVDNQAPSRGGYVKVPNTVNGSEPWIPSCSVGASPLNNVNSNAGGDAVPLIEAVSLGVTLEEAVLLAVLLALLLAVFVAVTEAVSLGVTLDEAVLLGVPVALSLAVLLGVGVNDELAVLLAVAVRVGRRKHDILL